MTRRNPPTVVMRPESPCLHCGLAAIVHNSSFNHAPVYFQPSWAVPQLKTGMCDICSTSQAKAGDLCGSCLSSYWNSHPKIAERLLGRGTILAI